jgi:pentatricopeptide repeat protein
MPSHIYVAMGMWDEVISSNIASYEASVARMNDKNLDNDARGYHAFKWLMYGYLQKGNFEKAKKMVNDMKKYCD